MRRHIGQRQGFTLLEIIIVSALITLLSGIALFSINQFYNSSRKKIIIAEAYQIATAMSIAEQDLQFFPRLNYLDLSTRRMSFGSATNRIVPRLDYFGHLSTNPPVVRRIIDDWAGPYMGSSPSRTQSGRSPTSGFLRMRLPDVTELFEGRDFSLVDWPSDSDSRPFLLYQFRTGSLPNGDPVPEFIERESEDSDFMTAIVSYGRNGVPGGNQFTNDATLAQLEAGALVVEGDEIGTGANYTLRTVSATQANLRLRNTTAGGAAPSGVHLDVLRSLRVANANAQTGEVGLLDRGNDDIVINF